MTTNPEAEVPKMTRTITILPAFDRRNPDPAIDQGIHGCEMVFLLQGPRGAVCFVLYTNWHLPEVEAEHRKQGYCPRNLPAELSYHGPKPLRKGQQASPCAFIPGGRCYGSGSVLGARPVYERLLREGSAGVWAALADLYRETFGPKGKAKAPPKPVKNRSNAKDKP